MWFRRICGWFMTPKLYSRIFFKKLKPGWQRSYRNSQGLLIPHGMSPHVITNCKFYNTESFDESSSDKETP